MYLDNGYGVSVIKYEGSYGYEQDLWEIATIYKGQLNYNTPIR